MSVVPAQDFVSSGMPALDAVLGGGFTPHRFYMVEGLPGSGKTTLAMQFLMEGAARGESVLYVTLSETEEEIRAVAHSHGWSLEGVRVLEVIATEAALSPDAHYTVFQPDEVELSETTKSILAAVERDRPTRVVFDSLSELRLLSGSPLRYRRQMLGLKQYFAGRSCTVLVLDDRTSSADDPQLQSIAHGIVALEQSHPIYGSERRRLRIVKYRGVKFIGGFHDFRIVRGGLRIFPRIVAVPNRADLRLGNIGSGIETLDMLLGGGIERGTSTLLSGAPGTGKSTVSMQFAVAAASRGERAVMYLFDESASTIRKRMAGLGMKPEPLLESGALTLVQMDPAELSPGEFADMVREFAMHSDAAVVVIDSLNGYLNSMPDDRLLTTQLHELLTFLGQRGIATVLVSVQSGLIGVQMNSPVDASYLADTVIVMRYFEALGAVRQAISVLKKRSGYHERTIREFTISDHGLHVGEPLTRFHGVLSGVPTFSGETDALSPSSIASAGASPQPASK